MTIEPEENNKAIPSWFPVEGKTYIVLGLARSGLAAVRWLLAKKAAVVIAIDDQSYNVAKAIQLGAQDRSLDSIEWGQVGAVIQSPGVPFCFPHPHLVTLKARQKGIPIIGDMDLFRLTHPKARFVGITGTNGKSTTTALVGHILKTCGVNCQIGGNIGIPVLSLEDAELYVLELSSYQLELSGTLDFHIGGWLNISPDHLDRHGSLESYVMAKKRLFRTHHLAQTVVMGIDDELSKAVWKEVANSQVTIPVSVNQPLGNGIYIHNGWLMDQGSPMLDVGALLTLQGVHNYQNVGVAYGICQALGLCKEDIVRALQTFPGLAHRQERVRTLNGVCFINDSKGTNTEATAKALATFDNIYWIAGGRAKSNGIDSLSSYFPKIVHAFLIGEAQDHFAEILKGKTPYTKSGNLEQAVIEAYRLASQNGLSNSVVLLSPACASFDQFCDFEHRGKVFCQLVHQLEA